MKFVTPASIMLITTMGCNVECDHCCLACSRDKVTIRMTEGDMMNYIRQADRFGVQSVAFSGGEPMLLVRDIVKPMLLAKSFGMYIDIRTNAYWAKSSSRALATIRFLRGNGLDRLGLSYDLFHARAIPVDNIKNAVSACNEIGIPTFLDWIGGESRDYVLKFLGVDSSVVRLVGPPMLAGRASPDGFPRTSIDVLAVAQNLCDTVSYLMTIFPQGHASYHPCCWVNPDLIRKMDSGVNNIGSLFNLMQESPMVNFLGDQGIGGLIRKARQYRPELLKKEYVHQCDICYDLLGELFPRERHILPEFLEALRGDRVIGQRERVTVKEDNEDGRALCIQPI